MQTPMNKPKKTKSLQEVIQTPLKTSCSPIHRHLLLLIRLPFQSLLLLLPNPGLLNLPISTLLPGSCGLGLSLCDHLVVVCVLRVLLVIIAAFLGTKVRFQRVEDDSEDSVDRGFGGTITIPDCD